MWCIGNEVPDQWAGDKGPKLSLWLQNICHREDPTRPVTQGMDAPDAVVNNNMAAVMDVPGFNYRPFKYIENYKNSPKKSFWEAKRHRPSVRGESTNSR